MVRKVLLVAVDSSFLVFLEEGRGACGGCDDDGAVHAATERIVISPGPKPNSSTKRQKSLIIVIVIIIDSRSLWWSFSITEAASRRLFEKADQ